MSQVPALREALQVAAERRYGRRRRAWRPVLAVLAVAAAAWLLVTVERSPTPPAAEETATPVATATVHTVKVEPQPIPATLAKPEIVKARPVEDGVALFQREGGASGRLERAWSTPWLQGPRAHVFLLRKGSDWCLSVPDPATNQPGDRGVGCSPDSEFKRFGISNTIGATYVAVVAPGAPAPTYRLPDGRHKTLEPAEGGLVAISNVEPGSAISLHDRSAKRRTDSFPAPVARNLHHCSDGTMRLIPASVAVDPCVPVG